LLVSRVARIWAAVELPASWSEAARSAWARPAPGLQVSRSPEGLEPGRLARAPRLAAMAMQARAVRQWRAARPPVHRVRAPHQFRVEPTVALSVWEPQACGVALQPPALQSLAAQA